MRDELARMGHGSKGKLAKFLGVRPAAISRMLNDSPGKEARRILAHELHALEVFFGAPLPASTIGVEVPLISWIAAGHLAAAEAVADIADCERIAVPYLDPKGDWIALAVHGDSMDRISPPDSIIVVDRKDRKLVPNACYVIGDGEGGATYKRFRPSPMRFEPVSTNPDHEPIFPDNEPKIVGRVRLSILRM